MPSLVHQSSNVTITRLLVRASDDGDIESILRLTDLNLGRMNVVNMATALHRIVKVSGATKSPLLTTQSNDLLSDQRFKRLMRAFATSIAQARLQCHAACVCQGDMHQPWTVSITAWSLATLHYTDTTIFNHLAYISYNHLHSHKPVELANTLWSFSRAGIAPPLLFNKAADFIRQNLGRFNLQGIATVLFSFAACKLHAPELVESALAELSVRDLTLLKPLEISNVCLAIAEFAPSAQPLLSVICDLAVDKLPQLKMSEVATVSLALGALLLDHPIWFERVSELPRRQSVILPHAINVIWALARLSRPFPAHLQNLSRGTDDISGGEMVKLLWALSELHVTRGRIVALIHDELMSSMRRYALTDISRIIIYLHRLGLHTPEVVAVAALAVRSSTDASADALVSAAAAFALIGYSDHLLFGFITIELTNRLDEISFPQVIQFLDILLRFNLCNVASPFLESCSTHPVLRERARWIEYCGRAISLGLSPHAVVAKTQDVFGADFITKFDDNDFSEFVWFAGRSSLAAAAKREASSRHLNDPQRVAVACGVGDIEMLPIMRSLDGFTGSLKGESLLGGLLLLLRDNQPPLDQVVNMIHLTSAAFMRGELKIGKLVVDLLRTSNHFNVFRLDSFSAIAKLMLTNIDLVHLVDLIDCAFIMARVNYINRPLFASVMAAVRAVELSPDLSLRVAYIAALAEIASPAEICFWTSRAALAPVAITNRPYLLSLLIYCGMHAPLDLLQFERYKLEGVLKEFDDYKLNPILPGLVEFRNVAVLLDYADTAVDLGTGTFLISSAIRMRGKTARRRGIKCLILPVTLGTAGIMQAVDDYSHEYSTRVTSAECDETSGSEGMEEAVRFLELD